MTRNFKTTLAYEGTQFAGWQWQPDRRTVQATLEGMLERVTGKFTRVAGSSRTDAGVHAFGQVASFRSETHLDPAILLRALNANAPDDLVVLKVDVVDDNFHATRDTVAKRYRYVIQDGRHRDLFSRHMAWRVWQTLDAEAMKSASRCLVGTHDFEAFQTSGSARESTVRTIRDIAVYRAHFGIHVDGRTGQGRGAANSESASPSSTESNNGDFVVIEVEANGFLYNMVRNIAGTLVTVGKGKQRPEWVAEVLASCDRRKAGMTAPPEGLCLLWVEYGAGTSKSSDESSRILENRIG